MSSLANIASAEMRTSGFQDVTSQMASSIDNARKVLQTATEKMANDKKEVEKAQKDFDKAGTDVSKAENKLSKAGNDQDKAAAKQELTEAKGRQIGAQDRYKTARGELKNDAVVLKNLQAQLDNLVNSAMPQLQQQQKTEAAGKKQAQGAEQSQAQSTQTTKDMAKQFGDQLKEVTKAVNDSAKALSSTAPSNVNQKGDNQLQDGQATAKDITQAFADPEGAGAKANQAFLKNPSPENTPHLDLLSDAAKGGKAEPAQAKTPTASPTGQSASSSYEAGATPAPSAKLSVGAPPAGLTAGSLDGEPPSSGPKPTADQPTVQSTGAGAAPAPSESPRASAPPASAGGATPVVDTTLPTDTKGAGDTKSANGKTAGDVPAQAQATRGDATDQRVSFKLDNTSPTAKGAGEPAKADGTITTDAKGIQQANVKLGDGSTAKLQFDPSKETLKLGEGKGGQNPLTVPMTEQQFKAFVKGVQEPAVHASAGNLTALAKKDPAAFSSILSQPQLKMDVSAKNSAPSAGAGAGASAEASPSISFTGNGKSNTTGASASPSASTGSASTGETANAGGTQRSSSFAAGDEDRLKQQFWKNFNDDILDRLLSNKKGDDKSDGSRGGSHGKGKAAAAGAAGAPAAVVGGGGAQVGGNAPQVLGLDSGGSAKAQGAGAGAGASTSDAAQPVAAAAPQVKLATDNSGSGGGGASSDGQSNGDDSTSPAGYTGPALTMEKANFPDVNAQFQGVENSNMSGMELVQIVLLIAAQQSQAEVRDMALQVQQKTQAKSDARKELEGLRSQQASMQSADAAGNGETNQWFAKDGNGGMTSEAIGINNQMSATQTKMDTAGDDNQLLFMKLQNLTQALTQTMQAASSVSKSLFDTSKAIVGNIGH